MSSTVQQLENTAANEPIPLDQPGIAWIVEAGHADLFFTRRLADGSPGARTHIVRIEAGNAFFGFETSSLTGQWTIIAQPGQEARIARIDRAHLPDAARLIGAWARCLTPGQAHTVTPAELDTFHRTVWQALIHELESDESKEKARLARTRESDAADVDRSIRRLAGPLSGVDRRALSDSSHPLMRACEAIGRAQQIVFHTPPEVLRGLPMRDPIRSICRSSGVRARRVVLGDSWYRREGLPLLAFRESDQRPLALLPRGSRSYEIFDPIEGTHTKVNGERASVLQPYAYTFYRPFHAGPVTLGYLLRFGLRGAWREAALVLLPALGVGALGVTMPLLVANAFDTIIPGAERQHMVEAALFLFATLLASTMLGLTRDFAFLRMEDLIEARVRAAILDRLLSLPARFFRNFSTAELAQRATAIGSIRRMLTGSAMSALFAGVFSFFSFALLFWFSRKLAMIATALTAVQLVAFATAAVLLWRLQRQRAAAQRASGAMLQLIGGIPKIRISGTERRAFSVWARAAAENWSLSVKARRVSGALGVFNSAFPLLAGVAIYYMAGRSGFRISTGSFVGFLLAYGAFSGALTRLVQAAIGLLPIVPVYRSAKPVLDAIPETDPSSPPAGELTGRIELSHVYFRYRKDGPAVLKNITLDIQPGEFVAFVGPSGSGKSTIFRILVGFERPESGTVFFDGQDLAALDISSVRQQMGIVLQNSTVFSGDIFQNIVCSGPFTFDQAWEAARMTGLDKDLEAMPMGMHTMVGDGGAGLSGGQRQRLMIARAVVGRPRILLFDEATSALDNQTQAVIGRSLEKMRTTRVVIAHRLSTVMKADRIFVIEKGEIVQTGTYAELMTQPGSFAELARRQLT